MNNATPNPGRRIPSFPLPVNAEYDEAARSADLVPIYGYCAPFCRMGGPTAGQTVAEHGHVCEGPGTAVDAWGGRQDPRVIWAHLVEPYRHGVYASADVIGRPTEPVVRLIWEPAGAQSGEEWGAFITPAHARSLAAALVRLADTAEGLDLPARRHGGETR
ncbi:hypothetical protein [Micrococcus luteus]|uniref:hypothetical protein n=1 Tax=Micrococcus luteus TaxID=1270 RepID=UPI0039173937